VIILKKEIDMTYFYTVFSEIYNSKYEKLNQFTQHKNSTSYTHSFYVAMQAYKYARRKNINCNLRSLIRGSLLHDYYIFNSDNSKNKGHLRNHPKKALISAKKDYELNSLEEEMILHHMWPYTFFKFPKHKETWILIKYDKIVSLKEALRPKLAEHVTKAISECIKYIATSPNLTLSTL